MAAEKKVRFGLKKVHYALLESDGTYGTPKPWTGAVALTLTPEGDSSAFYADDGPYAQFVVNGGYTGSLEMAVLEPQIAADLLGEAKDAIGGVYEDADAQPAPFALLFEIGGNVNQERYALYSCKMSRPTRESDTTTESTDPNTVTMDFTAIPKEMKIGEDTKNVTKYVLEDAEASHTVFAAWFDEVKTPTAAAA